MSAKKWVVYLYGLSLLAFSTNSYSNTEYKQQQLSRANQLDKTNAYADSVISTMQNLLQGYDVSTLSNAFSQEITNLTNYADGLNNGSGQGKGSNSKMKSDENLNKNKESTYKKPEAFVSTPPANDFNITSAPAEGEVNDITGF